MSSSSPLLLALSIVAIGFVAGIIPFFVRWTHETAHRWLAFGAGTILGAAFLHMIPEEVVRTGLVKALSGYDRTQGSQGRPNGLEERQK